jgi:hypothetical protein
MTLDASGNLGVGTTSPGCRLQVTQAASAALGAQFALQNNAASAVGNAVEIALLTDGGASPSGIRNARIRAVNESAGDGAANLQFWTWSGSTDAERCRVTAGGNLLVGCTAVPSTSVEGFCATGTSSGNLSSSGASTSAYNHWLFLNGNGTVGSISTSASATAFNTSSDVRLKKNITDAQDSGADVDALQVRSFDWKVDDLHVKYGFIAQELVTVAPDAVKVGDDGEEVTDTWGVDYSKLVPMLIKEVQSLRKRVAELEAK